MAEVKHWNDAGARLRDIYPCTVEGYDLAAKHKKYLAYWFTLWVKRHNDEQGGGVATITLAHGLGVNLANLFAIGLCPTPQTDEDWQIIETFYAPDHRRWAEFRDWLGKVKK